MGLKLVDRDPECTGRIDKPAIVACKPHDLSLLSEKVHRCQMERIQSSDRFRERLQSPYEDRRRELNEGDAAQKGTHLICMRSGKFARMNASPNFILKQAAGDQILLPKPFGRRMIFCKKVSQGNRGIEINHRSLRSCSNSRRSLRKDMTGLRGGGAADDSVGGVIQPWRTASASKASARTGLLFCSGGTSSATTRSRSVTSTVSPCAARRTYSLSLFFRTFRPTALIGNNVASGGYLCQASEISNRILDWRNCMNKTIWNRFLDSCSDNQQSKACPEPRRRIANLQPEADPPQAEKWAGLSVIAFVLVVTGVVAQAQQPKKVPRVGYLAAVSLSAISARIEAFRQGLRELGYVEGKNIVIERRSAEEKPDRLPALVAELVRLKVDVIVTAGPIPTRAAKEATSTIPIVMAFDNDPVGNGFVASLARPGENITGLSTLAPEISGKQLELLKEIVPRLSRVAVLGFSTNPGDAQALKEVELAARAFGVQLQSLDVLDPKDIETAFREASKRRVDAVLVLQSAVFTSHRKQLVELAVKSRLPAIYDRREFVEDGGLMSYGVSSTDLFRRAATYVDKILKGTKPADLPVEQPIKFEFIINLKAAKQIGLTIPQSVLYRADKVIR